MLFSLIQEFSTTSLLAKVFIARLTLIYSGEGVKVFIIADTKFLMLAIIFSIM